MYHIELAGMKYRYLVGPYNVAIITPSRKKHLVLLSDVKNPAVRLPDPPNGSADDRVAPEEVAAYILTKNLK
jgi:hypothetical protein